MSLVKKTGNLKCELIVIVNLLIHKLLSELAYYKFTHLGPCTMLYKIALNIHIILYIPITYDIKHAMIYS